MTLALALGSTVVALSLLRTARGDAVEREARAERAAKVEAKAGSNMLAVRVPRKAA